MPLNGAVFATNSGDQSVIWIFSGEAGVLTSVAVESYAFEQFDPFIEVIAPDGSSLGREGATGAGYGTVDNVRLPLGGFYNVRVSTLGSTGCMYGVFVET